MQAQESTPLKISQSMSEQSAQEPALLKQETQATSPQTQEEAQEGERRGPVAQAMRYRKRAQLAEQELAQLKGSLEELRGELTQSQQALARLERKQRIESELAEEETLDVEAARLLTEAAVQQMREPDVRLAVEDLKRHKPWLFRQRQAAGARAMPARQQRMDKPQVEQAAEQAASTGDRRDLLRYLRLRRKGK